MPSAHTICSALSRQKLAAAARGAEHAAGRGDVPAFVVVRRRHREPDAALQPPGRSPTRAGDRGRSPACVSASASSAGASGAVGWIAVGTWVSQKSSTLAPAALRKAADERIDALAPPDQGSPACRRRTSQARPARLDGLIAAAGQRHGEEIHQRALGLMDDLRRQVVPPCVDDEFCQNLGNARIVQHAPTLREIPASIGRPGQKCNRRRRLTAILMAAIRRYNLTRSRQPRGGFV